VFGTDRYFGEFFAPRWTYWPLPSKLETIDSLSVWKRIKNCWERWYANKTPDSGLYQPWFSHPIQSPCFE
jgi:hypothetical protein